MNHTVTASKGAKPADTLISDPQVLETWNNKFLLFMWPSQYKVFRYSSPEKLTQWLTIQQIKQSMTIVTQQPSPEEHSDSKQSFSQPTANILYKTWQLQLSSKRGCLECSLWGLAPSFIPHQLLYHISNNRLTDPWVGGFKLKLRRNSAPSPPGLKGLAVSYSRCLQISLN